MKLTKQYLPILATIVIVTILAAEIDAKSAKSPKNSTEIDKPIKHKHHHKNGTKDIEEKAIFIQPRMYIIYFRIFL